MMGFGKGTQNGILFKGGEYLEIARKVKTIVFDKTGTVTNGKPEVTDVIDLTSGTVREKEILRLAAIAESGSEHPLGQAIVRKVQEGSGNGGHGIGVVPNPDSFEALSGYGLRAAYSDHTILIGNRKLMDDNKIPVLESAESALAKLENEAKTAVLVAIDNKLSGTIALADTIKQNAREAIDSLKSMGIEVIMLTGDNKKTANTIASKLGINRVIAQVLPQQKEQVISKLR